MGIVNTFLLLPKKQFGNNSNDISYCFTPNTVAPAKVRFE